MASHVPRVCPQDHSPLGHLLPPRPLVPGGKAKGAEEWGELEKVAGGPPRGRGTPEPGDETGHSAEENQSSEITLNMKCYSLL